MASPQIENGYTKVANELLDALCASQLGGHEWSVVHAVIRKTYGYNKKEDWVTNTQIAEMTGLNRHRVSEAKTKLLAKGIVTEKRNKIALVKDYDSWSMLRNNVHLLRNNVQSVTEYRIHKRNKDNIQKKVSEHSSESKNKDMPFNKYSDEFEEGVIDYDSGEMSNPEEPKPKGPSRKRMDELVNWLINHQGRDTLRTNRPKQYKALKELVKMKVTGDEAKQVIMEAMQDDYWKGRKEQPDFSTAVAIIQKRG